MENARVGAERLEVERAGGVERVEQHDGVGERERTVCRRERGLVEQRDPLAPRELEVCRGSRRRDRPSGPDRSDRSSRASERREACPRSARRRRAGRARAARRSCRTRTRSPAAAPSHERSRGRRGALRRHVLAHEQPIVARRVGGERLAAADPGRHAVRLAPSSIARSATLARPRHPLESASVRSRRACRRRATASTSARVRSEPVRTTGPWAPP